MKVQLLAHTQLSDSFIRTWSRELFDSLENAPDSAIIALSAIRTCYSHNKPSDIVLLEGDKYFNKKATDGKEGTEADRLFRHIVSSKHTSTLEHINYTFAIEGVSRSLLAQLTRHRQFSFSVQSQRYVKFGSEDKSGGFNYMLPQSLEGKFTDYNGGMTAGEVYISLMDSIQAHYDVLREMGVPAEDARMVLPNAATCNLVMTGNLRAILEFYSKRKKGNGAQLEIAELAEAIKDEVIEVDKWVSNFFD